MTRYLVSDIINILNDEERYIMISLIKNIIYVLVFLYMAGVALHLTMQKAKADETKKAKVAKAEVSKQKQ